MKDIIAKGVGGDEAELVMKRVVLRLEGYTHEEALVIHPRLEPKLDRDGVVR
jgi:hypothetical protein